MGTTLILVRHGESDANGNKFFAGQLDIDLSQRGRQQAELTASYICAHYSVDAVYASDLKRAYHTAEPIARACGVETVKMEQLREIYAGQWQGMHFDDLERVYAQEYGQWRQDIGKAHPNGGESVEDLSERVWTAVQEIVEREQGKTVAIVTHATPIRALLCRIKGMALEDMKAVAWVSNASVSVVQVEDGWTLEQESVDQHLAELKTRFPANV